MQFSIMLGNHVANTYAQLGDVMLHLKTAIDDLGHSCDVHYDILNKRKVVIFFEGFLNDRIVDQIVSFEASDGKFGIVFLDRIKGKSSRISESGEYELRYIENRSLDACHESVKNDENRFRNFVRLAPYADFIWCILEKSVQPLRDICQSEKVFHLPMGYVEKMFEVEQRPFANREYDFALFGRQADYRKQIVTEIRKKGFNVLAPRVYLPRYARNDALSRVKLSIWPRLTEYWDIPSIPRHAHALNNAACQINERTGWDTHLDPFMELRDPDRFVEACLEAIESQEFFYNQARLITDFRENCAMRPRLAELLERSLS